MLPPQGQRDFLFSIPEPSNLWSLDLILFRKKSLATPSPLVLLLLKALSKVSSIHLSFYKRQEEACLGAASAFHSPFSTHFQCWFSSPLLRNLLKTLICGWPTPTLFALTFFFFLFVRAHLTWVSRGTRSKLGTDSTNKNFHLLKWLVYKRFTGQVLCRQSSSCTESIPIIFIHSWIFESIIILYVIREGLLAESQKNDKIFNYIFSVRYTLQIISSFHACCLILFFPFKHTKYWLKINAHEIEAKNVLLLVFLIISIFLHYVVFELYFSFHSPPRLALNL